jgi:filamentous hemagglutinin family protein
MIILLSFLGGNVLRVHANPVPVANSPVSQGTATINGLGSSQVTINQTSANAFINWTSFNIAPGETTTFNQPSSSSITWNYINDPNNPNASSINGNINAIGYVVLQNPNGFAIGGQATITAHGLVMTTASTPALNLSSGGPWSFNTPPPTANIINYGQINITGGGSAFLIAADIENGIDPVTKNIGTISAPGGKIGLYAGQTVLISTSPDGRGLSAQVTLPQGSVDNEGKLIADGGSIAAQAQMVNQNGLVQANSAQNVNGTIELIANDTLNLTASSVISAEGNNQAAGAGGAILQAGNTVNNNGQVVADGSSIQMTAPTVNQSGTLQANSLGNINGTVEIDAVASLNLGASSVISANVDPTATTPSAGGSVTIQSGNKITLDTGSEIQADAGSITLDAPTVDQSGTLQANSSGNANGVIEIDASESLTLESSSVLSAIGDSSATSPGGFVVLKSDNTFADISGSTISVSGNNGGANGFVEIFGVGTTASTVNSTIDGAAAGQYSQLLVNPFDLTLSSDPTANISLSTLSSYSQIDLHALDDINIGSAQALTDPGLTAGQGIDLTAGNGIYLWGTASLQTQGGDINLWAANEVQVGWSGTASPPGIVNPGTGSITTAGGGSISVTTQSGDVNTGSNPSGFLYLNAAPYYYIDPVLGVGGISTSAGGNVTINAGGDVISYNPSGATVAGDAGTGAFGTQPGNVTITAGGNVYGHYVLANGLGTVTAGKDVGVPSGGNSFALSLIGGSWTVNAPNGNIYLQEVRNPNALFNTTSTSKRGQPVTYYNFFTYGSQDSVDLTAGIGVYLTDLNVPRLAASPVPVIYPPILDISAGSGGVTLQDNVTLFPSTYQNLDITTTGGGSLVSMPNILDTTPELLMSDSSQTRWINSLSFSDSDNGTVLPDELINPNPVMINISGNMENLNLITTKETVITVDGNMMNCGFSGQNLQAGDVTSISVIGQIFNASSYSFAYDIAIPSLPAADLPVGMGNSWNNIFNLAVDPTAIANLTLPASLTPAQWLDYALRTAALFSVSISPSGQPLGVNPGFVYDPTTERLGFAGPMQQRTISALGQPITVLHLVNGQAVIDTNPGDHATGRTYGQLETDTVAWADPAVVQTLFQESQNAPSPQAAQLGYRLGGPGQFDIQAGSISLGNCYGILSCGVSDPAGGFGRYGNLAAITPSGATVNVTVTDPDQPADSSEPVGPGNPIISSLDMLTSTIAALGGGDVNVTSTSGSMDLGSQELFSYTRQEGLGVYTSGGGKVSVIALGDVDIDGSRIGTYNGGDIFVESLQGTVNVGSGGSTVNDVYVSYVDSVTGLPGNYAESAYGSGIIANTLVPPQPGTGETWPPNPASLPGNITVKTPQGDIIATSGGILQEALDGTITAGPAVTLTAGTPASGTPGQPGYSPGHVGNIDLGSSGIIGGTVNLTANGNISGQVVSRQNSTVNAAQSFSGTVLSAGSANVTGGGTISGTIIGVGGASVSGVGGVTASVLGQNVSVNGGAAQSTLGSSASATSASQSAAQQANSQATQQVASDDNANDDQKKKKTEGLARNVGRVTVILPRTS